MLVTQQEINEKLEADVSLSIEKLSRSIVRAEKRFISPILGKSLYSALSIWAENRTPNAEFESLLPVVQDALLPYALYLYIDRGQAVIGDAGIHSLNTDETTAPQWWQIKDHKRSYFDEAYEMADELIEFLEDNEDDYLAWKTSTFYTRLFDRFIQTTEQFQSIYNIRSSRYLFVQLEDVMRHVESFIIQPWLGKDFTAELKNAIKSPSPNQQEVIDMVRHVVAYHTLSEALTRTQFILDGDSVRITMPDRKGSKDDHLSAPAVILFRERRESDASAWMVRVTKHLNENADSFPTWKNSDRYEDPNEADEPSTLTNRNGKIIGL